MAAVCIAWMVFRLYRRRSMSSSASSIPCTPFGTGRTSCTGVQHVHDVAGTVLFSSFGGPGSVRAKRIHPDRNSLMISMGGPGGPGGPGEFDLSRVRACACARCHSLTGYLLFIIKYPDHPDQSRDHAGFSPDHHPDHTRTTRTGQMIWRNRGI